MPLEDEMRNARLMARHMDAIFEAFDTIHRPEVMYQFDVICRKCGAKEVHMSRTMPLQSEYLGVCRGCSNAEA